MGNKEMKEQKERIVLELIKKSDTPLIVKWRNNEKVRKNFIFQEIFTEEMHNKWMDTKVASGEVVQFIIRLKESKKAIGSVYFRDIDYDKKEAEYGIFIGEDTERGMGYGSEAARLALAYAFSELKLESVFLRVFADNTAAIRSYSSVGFEETEYQKNAVKNDGIFRDLIFMKKYNDLL
ncbi:MAG: GNAT family N-acetyltransferase [Lachnospiraceae bacterium]|nr:GNAT family N-acetyltransferase [Lachnospiraceae bacterium]